MRACALVLALLSVILVSAPAAAQEAEALRRELEALQKQLQSVTDRLQKLETQRTPAPVPAPAPAPPPPGAAAPGTSVTDLARPRQPFTLYQQRGAGQLLFDMGVTGDFVGNLTQSNVEKAGGGTFGGQENRFFPREVELSLFGQIDPYASAEVRIEAGEDARGPDTGVSLAEASVTMLTLPFGTQAKFGQVRNRFGYSNVIHEHDLGLMAAVGSAASLADAAPVVVLLLTLFLALAPGADRLAGAPLRLADSRAPPAR